MPTRSYIVPANELTIEQRIALRDNADDVLLQAARRLAIRDRDEDLVLRDVLPNTDLNLATTQDWLVAGAGVAGTQLQYVSNAIALDRIVAFYGIAVETPLNQISQVQLTLGPTSSQVRGSYQIEKLNPLLESVGYLSEVVVFIRQETCRIMVLPRTGGFAANSQKLIFLSRTLEPIGTIVSAPSV